jgi:F-type H+-transporting ATPase subunit delta
LAQAPARHWKTVTNRTAATRYARALLDVAHKEQADLALIESQLSGVAGVFASHEALRKALVNPAVPLPRKRAAVAALVEQAGVLPVVARTLLLLAERDRLALVGDVAEAFSQRLLDLRNVVRASVTTAEPLAAERLDAIRAGLAAATGRTVDLSSRVDPAIIGGMIAKVGSTVFDASVTSHLQRIRQRLDASI